MAQTTIQSLAAALSGLSFRNNLNTILGALFSASSGATAPSPTVGGQFWLDTGVSPVVLRVRNNANTAWLVVNPETIGANSLWGNSSGSAAAMGAIDMATLRTMLGFDQSFAGSSYVKLPGGLIMNFGTGTTSAGGTASITFATAFPTACRAVLVSPAATVARFMLYDTISVSGVNVTTLNSSSSGVATSFSYLALGN